MALAALRIRAVPAEPASLMTRRRLASEPSAEFLANASVAVQGLEARFSRLTEKKKRNKRRILALFYVFPVVAVILSARMYETKERIDKLKSKA